MTEVDLQVVEILRNFGSQERFIGVVDHYDLRRNHRVHSKRRSVVSGVYF